MAATCSGARLPRYTRWRRPTSSSCRATSPSRYTSEMSSAGSTSSLSTPSG
jgi:hypothetical protein